MRFPLPDGQGSCLWNGRAFEMEGRQIPVLTYDTSVSGWTDDLTELHQDIAGDNHYIDVASRNHAMATLSKAIPAADSVVIDIGCSSGALLRALRNNFPQLRLIGADYISGPLHNLAKELPGVPFLQFNLVTCPLYSQTVDAAILLNVLEHIDDDAAALSQVFRILKPGGVAIIEVPAGPHLFDIYDKQLMHRRRYTIASLCSKLQQAGFEVEARSHLGVLLYPAFTIVKRRNQSLLDAPEDVQKRILSQHIAQGRTSPLFSGIMRIEAWLRPHVPFPFGIRCLAVGRKPRA